MRALLLRAGLALSAALAACTPAPLRIEICGPARLNRGLPMMIVARATDRGEHQEETYSAAAQRASQADAGRLLVETVNPRGPAGFRRRLHLVIPAKKALGLYFLFGEPHGSWKVLFEPPLKGRVQVELDALGVQRAAR